MDVSLKTKRQRVWEYKKLEMRNFVWYVKCKMYLEHATKMSKKNLGTRNENFCDEKDTSHWTTE